MNGVTVLFALLASATSDHNNELQRPQQPPVAASLASLHRTATTRFRQKSGKHWNDEDVEDLKITRNSEAGGSEEMGDQKLKTVTASGGIYDDSTARFLHTARAMSEENLEALDARTKEPSQDTIDLDSLTVVPVLQPGIAKPTNMQERVSALESDLANALELAKVAEAAAARANTELAIQQRRLADNELKVQGVESNLSSYSNKSRSVEDVNNLLKQIAENSSALPDLKAESERMASMQKTFQDALRLIESRLNVASQQAFNAEHAARRAVNESLKAGNETAVMRARETNAAYAIEEMKARLSDLKSLVRLQHSASKHRNQELEEMVSSLQTDLSHLTDHSSDDQGERQKLARRVHAP